MVKLKSHKSLILISKSLIIALSCIIIILFLSSCDETFLDVYTQINTNYSGTRTIELGIKTEYLKKGELIFSDSQPLYDKILLNLPKGKIETYEKDEYTYFKSVQEFNDINFLKHVSIDNYSETPPEYFYAKMETENYFFYSNYFFNDYIDMNIEETVIESESENGDFSKINSFFNADKDLFKITYQVKFPVKIINSNSDLIGDNNIAIWNIQYGEQKSIYIEGKRTKFLTYFLIGVLGIVGLFIIFLIFAITFSRRRRRVGSNKKPYYTHDNYFKKDRYFN
ncbi:MAG: hypothetical protein FJW61_06640 [Actinobacteria bacterium]|nr:hypothetical protein [Actinomycetota bacterium]